MAGVMLEVLTRTPLRLVLANDLFAIAWPRGRRPPAGLAAGGSEQCTICGNTLAVTERRMHHVKVSNPSLQLRKGYVLIWDCMASCCR